MIFIDGSKSIKLAQAFDLLDTDADGYLSRRDIWRLFRSFLCALLVASRISSPSSNEDDKQFERVKFLLDASCMWLVDSLFGTLVEGQTRASFDNIADWYSSDGCQVASWLELLDKRKWRFISENNDTIINDDVDDE
jgi:hypothetical protein